MPIRFAECFPSDWRENRVRVLLPFGAIEWHGDHLPLGLDGLVVEWFASELADQNEALLMPTVWTPVTTLPHEASLDIPTWAFRGMIDALLKKLAAGGTLEILLVTGHYAQGHLWELYDAAERAMASFPEVRVWAATPLEPLHRPELLDHAAYWEACQLLAIRPDLVRLSELATLEPGEAAVLGADPRPATAEVGRAILAEGLAAWQAWLSASREALADHYAHQRRALQSYRDAYATDSWEAGIERWWHQRTSQHEPQ